MRVIGRGVFASGVIFIVGGWTTSSPVLIGVGLMVAGLGVAILGTSMRRR